MEIIINKDRLVARNGTILCPFWSYEEREWLNVCAIKKAIMGITYPLKEDNNRERIYKCECYGETKAKECPYSKITINIEE